MEILTDSTGQVIVAILILINVIAFLMMAHDKRKATHGRNAERAPEGFMFFLAAMSGSAGVYLGMIVFRHKTRKWYFQIGIPMLILQNLALIYVVWQLIEGR
jgi:uncharacterized membrane protein YsdA (DUF1294 family)